MNVLELIYLLEQAIRDNDDDPEVLIDGFSFPGIGEFYGASITGVQRDGDNITILIEAA